ncbi:hypothetical protein [Pendulispora albinea]|uniref:Chromosome partition protein Smc n=1 Tax=Pendulispora albinea TaxID=2741071 RepID=A0ABZ2LWE8_9BACT
MSVLTTIWAASIGAALFFAAAGFFVARALVARREKERERDAERDRGDLARALLRAKHHEDLAASARGDVERTVRELARVSEAEQRVRHQLEDERRAAEEQKAELARMQREVDQLARARGELARAEKELAATKNRTAQLESRGTEGEAMATKKIVELAASVSSLREQLAGVNKKEQQAREGLEGARAELEALRREAALRTEETRAAKMALDVARNDTAGLRQDGALLNEALKRVAALEADNARLRALEFAHKAQQPKKGSDVAGELATPPASGLDGRSLQRFVDDVVRSQSVSAAALTDELGFLVAGNGDYTEALAAFGAYLTEAGARACGLLPMHAVQRVSVQDDSGITLTARTVASAPNELVLVTLGVEGGRERSNGRNGERERTS